MNELGNTPSDKNYQPSGISRAEEAALDWYPFDPMEDDSVTRDREHFVFGYDQALEDIISLIESRISEILGDAQPKPALRLELRQLIDRIKNE